MARILFGALAVCLMPGVLQAQQITGVVRNPERLPVIDAQVMVVGGTATSQTDAQGRFELRDLPTDKPTTIAVLVAGREVWRGNLFVARPVSVVELMVDPNEVRKDPALQLKEEVTVTAELPDLRTSLEAGTIALTPQQIVVLPSLGSQDVFRALQLLPGVSSQESSSGLYIRGGTPDQNFVDYDGFTVYHVDHLFGFFSAFNMNAIERVELSKGGQDVRYGGRLSGVTEIVGKTVAPRVGGEAGVSLLNVDGLFQTPVGSRISLVVAARRSFQGPLYNKILNIFDSTPTQMQRRPGGFGGFGGGRFAAVNTTPTSSFHDFNAKAAFRPTATDQVTISLFRGQDDLDNSRDIQIPEQILSRLRDRGIVPPSGLSVVDTRDWGNFGASGRWTRRWTDAIQTQITFSSSSYNTLRNRSANTSLARGSTFEDNTLADHTFRFSVPIQLNSANDLELGLQWTRNRTVYSFENGQAPVPAQTGPPAGFAPPPATPAFSGLLNRNQEGAQISSYVQDRWMVGRRLFFSPGLRITRFDETGRNYMEPRGSATFVASDSLRLKSSWGRHHQFTSRLVREDLLQGNREFWTVSDGTTVPVSSATQVAGGFAYEKTNWLLDVEAYHKSVDDLSQFAPRLVGADGGVDLSQFLYSGNGRIRGLEVLAQKKVGSNTGWLSYTASRVEQNFPDLSSTPFPADYDRTHELKVVDSHRFGRRLIVTGTWTYSTGTPYTEPSGVEDISQSIGPNGTALTIQRVVAGEKNSARLPNYHRLDLAAHLNLPFGTSSRRNTLSFTFFNAYNRNNIWYREFSIVEGEILETNVGLMGRTFNASWSLTF